MQRLGGIDFVGCVLFAGGILLILVGLTLGGAVYPWDSAPTVATIVVGFGMLVALAVHQVFVKHDGIFRKVRASLMADTLTPSGAVPEPQPRALPVRHLHRA